MNVGYQLSSLSGAHYSMNCECYNTWVIVEIFWDDFNRLNYLDCDDD